MSFINRLVEFIITGSGARFSGPALVLFVIGAVLLTATAVNIVCTRAARRFLHLLQLESYQEYGYDQSVDRNQERYVKPLFTIVAYIAGAEMLCMVLPVQQFMPMMVISLVCLCVFFAWGLAYTRRVNAEKLKKDFVLTPRMKRLRRCYIFINQLFCTLTFVVGGGLCLGAEYLLFGSGNVSGMEIVISAVIAYVCALLAYSPLFFTPNIVRLAARLRQKPEQRINDGFVNDAKRIIQSRGELIRIGITGSYGKTSAKFILGSILQEKYNVLVPPSSYNTPMGVTIMIRELLKPEHEVMIAEMGARRTGEIAELCDIVRPHYGILTSIGNQHLETFGSLDNIARTKFELAQSIPADGMAFFPKDGGKCEELAETFDGNKQMFGFGEGLYIAAQNVTVGPLGSEFDLVCSDGSSVHCGTRLLGRHNIMNILGCAACARTLGMEMQAIANGIAKAEPVEHRLQLIDPGTGVLIIDDAFNSNPAGTQAAMDVLGMFEGRRKICITPGMVELGEDEDKENRAFGTRMAGVCDVVILVGKKRTQPIMRGLLDGGFDERMTFRASNLDEATAILGELTQAGDVVLFENDLPDNYEE